MATIKDNLLKLSIIINMMLIFFGYMIGNLYIIQIIALFIVILSYDKYVFKLYNNSKIWLFPLIISYLSIVYSAYIKNSLKFCALITLSLLLKIILENSKEWKKYFVNCLLVCAFIHVIATIVQLLFPNLIFMINCIILSYENLYTNQGLYYMGSYAGITGQTAVNAFYIAIAIGIIIIKILINNKHFLTKIFMLLLSMVAMVLTAKRGMLIFSVIGVMFATSVYFRNKKKSIIKYILFIMLFIFIGYIILLNTPNNIIDKWSTLSAQADMTNGRTDLWKATLEVFDNHLFFGVGIAAITMYIGEMSHNVYIQLLGEVGIIGFALFITAFLYSLLYTLKYIKIFFKEKKFDEKAGYLILSVYIQTLFLLYCMTGNPLYSHFFFMPYILSISLTNSLYDKE